MLEVHTDQPLHLISELIYGTNSSTEAATRHPAVVRAGGNRWTAYNWEINASDAGSDYMFQNDDFLSSSTQPAAPVLELIQQATAAHAAALTEANNGAAVVAAREQAPRSLWDTTYTEDSWSRRPPATRST